MTDILNALVQSDPDLIPENPFETLVGEGKKFADANALAKAKIESDRFIQRLTAEQEELRREVQSKSTIDEIMTQIRSLQPAPTPQVPPLSPATPAEKNEPDIEQLVLETLGKRDQAQKAAQNKQTVIQKLNDVWGADAAVNLQNKAKELNVSIDYLNRLAAENPKVFFKTVDLVEVPKSAPQAVVPQSRIAQPSQPNQSGVRNYAYYQSMKARDRVGYFSPKTQNQMYKDAMELGESFYS